MKNTTDYSDNLSNSELSVNGNNLFYVLGDLTLRKVAEIFNDKSNIDSIISICETDTKDNYIMKVYERNGSISNFCGNGAIGTLIFLNKEEIYFLVNEKRLSVKKIKGKIEAEFTIDTDKKNLEESGIISSIGNYEKLKDKFKLIIKGIFDYYTINYAQVYDLFKNDSLYGNYITHIMSYIKNDELYIDFLEEIEVKGIGTSNGEPHFVVNIKKGDLGKKTLDIYMKITSFLIRNSFLDGKKIFPNDINIMFVDENDTIYPAERGVLNGINYDKTGACGTGTTTASEILGETKFLNLKGENIETKNNGNGSITLIVHPDKINKILKKDTEEFLPKNIIEEQLYYVLEKFKLYGDNLDEISKKIISNLGIPSLDKIKEILGTNIFNSGWHENEYPIDPYKYTTVETQNHIGEKFDLNKLLFYLDTMKINDKNISSYPNISYKKNTPRVLKSITNFIKESDYFTEFLKKFREVYEKINLFDTKNSKDFLYIFGNLDSNLVELIKYTDNVDNIYKGFYKFFLQKVKTNWNELKLNPNIREKYINKWFQDYILSIYFSESDAKFSNDLIADKIELFSNSNFIKKIKDSSKIVLSNDVLSNLFEIYFKKLIENKNGTPIQIGKTVNNENIILKESSGKLIYLMIGEKNNQTELSKEDFYNKLSSDNISVFFGNYMLFFLYLSGQIQLGSERGFREIFINSLKELNINSKDFEAFLNLTYISGDYDPNNDIPNMIFAGSDYTSTGSIYASVMLGKEFIKKEQKEMVNYMKKNEIDIKLVKKSILLGLVKKLEFIKEKLINKVKIEINIDNASSNKAIKEFENDIDYITHILTFSFDIDNIDFFKILSLIKKHIGKI